MGRVVPAQPVGHLAQHVPHVPVQRLDLGALRRVAVQERPGHPPDAVDDLVPVGPVPHHEPAERVQPVDAEGACGGHHLGDRRRDAPDPLGTHRPARWRCPSSRAGTFTERPGSEARPQVGHDLCGARSIFSTRAAWQHTAPEGEPRQGSVGR
ncbi:hypothetical protein BBK82_42620 [Lentzea guizhouensis]|uniref:Uncharacterized protein n=1 Tax=Lentzea guizhouensis TaxID=1586287 RepID=A0A1B2HV85_9PSEU|nr:hypothetical protein BBK82_42620 [Lentzea guizhouensis]